MLQWKDVKFALDGMLCTVIFDTSKHPRIFKKYTGRIQVADVYDAMPLLKNPTGNRIMSVPWYATVILHTPSPLETDNW